jgi:SulP family sulfate permease
MFKEITFNQIKSDFVAALMVCIILVPQGLGYALLAGLPPQIGIYASILPMFIYAFIGSSKTLSVGPVAVLSIMTMQALSGLAEPMSAHYIWLASLLAILTGLLLSLLAFLRLGRVFHFISPAMLSGFMFGSIILVIYSQSKEIVHPANIKTLHIALGILSVLVLWFGRIWLEHRKQQETKKNLRYTQINSVLPLLLVCLTVAVLASVPSLKSHVFLVYMPDHLPSGLVFISWDYFAQSSMWRDILILLPSAVSMAVVVYASNLSMAQTLAKRRHETLNPQRELWAAGLTNIVSGLFAAYPVSGGFARSMVNFSSGAKSQWSSLFSGLLMLILLYTSLNSLSHLPTATLAAIVLVSAAQTLDFQQIPTLWHEHRSDFWVFSITAGLLVCVGIETGLIAGLLTQQLFNISKKHAFFK